ncbi:LysR family transcriptional regulator [Bradyrhizobium prioriisuperbiae]|uniref:LysR family transcriptional regulator n=1 Tax=Bradyrhizobium prioriisuperbiae TaxID=2854389 RepID=UPI0028E3811C|nr:LysR family transcriptional regulator [Bradyrhizobium prioritasuperba]
MHRAIGWEDLQYILAVAENGSLANAARVLKVNHTTVLRRINAFEEAHGLRLFERLPTGYTLTAGGEELLAAARTMSDVVTTLERKLAGQDLRIEGGLRLTTTDTLIASVLPEILSRFHGAHPGVRVEVSTTNLLANLTRRDADVAIRPANNPPETLIGRRISEIAFALYTSSDFIARHGRSEDLKAYRWLAPDDTLSGSSIALWMKSALPGADIVLRADSLVTLRQAAIAGVGVAALPCYLGDNTPGLTRLLPEPFAPMATSLWILTHEDLRRTARVNAFVGFFSKALSELRPLFEGRASRAVDPAG